MARRRGCRGRGLLRGLGASSFFLFFFLERLFLGGGWFGGKGLSGWLLGDG